MKGPSRFAPMSVRAALYGGASLAALTVATPAMAACSATVTNITGLTDCIAQASAQASGATTATQITTTITTSTASTINVNSAAGSTLNIDIGTRGISGSYGLVIGGSSAGTTTSSGTVIFTSGSANAKNSYTGGTTLNAGTLVLYDAQALGGAVNNAGTFNFNGGTLKANAALTFLSAASSPTSHPMVLGNGSNVTFDPNSFLITYSPAISGGTSANPATINISDSSADGSGSFLFNGNNTFVGRVNINRGAAQVSRANSFGAANNTINLNGGKIIFNSGLQASTTVADQNYVLNAASTTVDVTAGNLGLGGTFTGTGGLNIVGGKQLTLTGSASYTGGTVLSGTGTTLAGGVTGLTGSITTGSGTAIRLISTVDGTFNASVNGGASLTKTGGGVVTIANVQTYTGGTFITAGSLVASTSTLSGNVTFTDPAVTSIPAPPASPPTPAARSLIFNQDFDGNFLGIIKADPFTYASGVTGGTVPLSGTGAASTIVKRGTGIVSLTGASPVPDNVSTFAIAGVTIEAGGLRGDLASSFAGAPAFTVLGPGTLYANQASDYTYTGLISGAGNLTKEGAGNLTLTGANSYTGVLTINGGAVTGTLATIGASNGGIVDNGRLNLNGGGTYNGNLSGTGSLVTDSANPLVLGGATTITGGITIGNDITLAAGGGGGGLSGTGNVTFTDAANGTFTGPVSITGGITKTGAGNLTLDGTVTLDTDHSGGDGIVINGGGLAITSIPTLGAGGTVTDNGTFTIANATDGTFANAISGSGAFVKDGAGTLTLSGTNTYMGGTTVSNGTLVINDLTSLGSGGIVDNGNLILNQATDATYNGGLSGTGNLTKNGAGVVTLTGANTLDGDLIINGGNLIALGGSFGPITINSGATFTTNSQSTPNNIRNDGTVVFDQTVDGTYAGTISRSGQVIKQGNATLTLTGPNTYSGGTRIDAGTLVGDTTSLQGNIVDNAALEFAQGGNGTFAGNISGTGSLTKSGAGNLTFTGTNSYSGGTTITSGTLTGNTMNLQGNIVDNAALVFDQATDGTYAGNLSGTGTLTKLNAGNLTLTGTNSFSGGTTITGGTLTASSASIGTGNVVDNGVLAFNQTSAGTYAGIISGSGSLVKNGAGNLTLTGANSFTGGITISGGTLTGSTTSLLGPIANSGTVAFNQATDASYTSAITGTGSLVKNGAGNLTLTGANTYSGGTTISAGTLTVNTTTLTGNVVDNGTLAFNQAATGTFAGNITGTGALVKSGAGALTLSGTNTYSGGTTISGGSLLGSTTNLQGNIVNNGGVTFAQTTDGTYAGVMSGTGTLTKTGAGRLSVTGTNTYTGATTVSAGTLAVFGSLASNVSVSSGATIIGTGTIGGLTLANSATLNPGASPGTLTVSGNVSFGTSSTYVVEVDPVANIADKLVVGGTAALGGTVSVQAGGVSANYGNVSSYTILTASGGVSGTFANVTSNYAFLTPTLSYGANNVVLTLTRNDIVLAAVAQTANQLSVARALDASAIGTAIYTPIIMLSAAGARGAYDSLSGEIHADLRSVRVQQSRTLRNLLLTRMEQGEGYFDRDGGEKGLWIQATHLNSTYGATNGLAGARDRLTTGMIGFDLSLAEGWRAGIAAGYGESTLAVDARASSAKTSFYTLSGYTGAMLGNVRLRAGVTLTFDKTDTLRQATAGTLSEANRAHAKGSSWQLFGELGYNIDIGATHFEPFAGLSAVGVRSGTAIESGAVTALVVRGDTQTFSTATAGLKFGAVVDMGSIELTPHASAALDHALGGQGPSRSASFALLGPASDFTVLGLPQIKDSAQVQAGLGIQLGGGLSFDASYEGNYGRGIHAHGGHVGLALRF